MARNPAAQTAFGPMVLAAVEHNEPPERRVVDDDLAHAFLPPHLRALVRATRSQRIRKLFIDRCERTGPGVWASIACRKRLIDERLSDPLTEFDAVVILGAGLDTRGYRIARHSELPVFEVDQQVNIERKARAVRRALGVQPASVKLVAVDLADGGLLEALRTNGYRDSHRTLFIWEGVTQYLTPEAVGHTLAQLRWAVPGSRLIFTYIRQDFIDGTNLYGADGLYQRFCTRTPVWKSGMVPENVNEMLAEHDWRLFEQVGPAYFRDTYLRPAGRELRASPIEWTALAER